MKNVHLLVVILLFVMCTVSSLRTPPYHRKMPTHMTSEASCSSHLSANVVYPLYPSSDPLNLPSVYNTLTTCHNITSLHLRIARSGGCVIADGPFNFDFGHDDKFPSLIELRISGYDFDDYAAWRHDRYNAGYDRTWSWEYTWLDMFTGQGPSKQVFPATPKLPEPQRANYLARNLEKWRKAMDWTLLKVLEVREPGPGFLMRMAELGALQGLKELKLVNEGYWDHRWEKNEMCERESLWIDFVRATGHSKDEDLKELHWVNLTDAEQDDIQEDTTPLAGLRDLQLYGPLSLQVVVNNILPSHQSSLSTLCIRQYPYPATDVTLDTEHLAALSNVSKLSSLTLDIPINASNSWPFELLKPLTQIWNLQYLTLHLHTLQGPETECKANSHTMSSPDQRDYYPYRRPSPSRFLLNITIAYDLFVFLRTGKEETAPEFIELRLWNEKNWGVVCRVLDENGLRKREGIAWCEEAWEHEDQWDNEDDDTFGVKSKPIRKSKRYSQDMFYEDDDLMRWHEEF